MTNFRQIDPAELRVPPSRAQGADPEEALAADLLVRAINGGDARPLGLRGCGRRSGGTLVEYNGVTRATRVAKLAPGTPIQVEVIGTLPQAYESLPRIGDLLP